MVKPTSELSLIRMFIEGPEIILSAITNRITDYSRFVGLGFL